MKSKDGMKTSSRFWKTIRGWGGIEKYEEEDMNWFLNGLVLFLQPFHWLTYFWFLLFFLIGYAPFSLLDWFLCFVMEKTKRMEKFLLLRKCCRIIQVEITSILRVVK